MASTTPTADFFNSSVQIAFVYPEIGADRDIPYVYWNNEAWVQVQYDAFREEWNEAMPIFHGGCEAICRYYGLDPAGYTPQATAGISPDRLQLMGNSLPGSEQVIYLQNTLKYCRWYDAATKTDFLAEGLTDGKWTLASLDKDTFSWVLEKEALSDTEFYNLYTSNPAAISLISGLPPQGPTD